MPQAIERSLATPMTRPRLPFMSSPVVMRILPEPVESTTNLSWPANAGHPDEIWQMTEGNEPNSFQIERPSLPTGWPALAGHDTFGCTNFNQIRAFGRDEARCCARA